MDSDDLEPRAAVARPPLLDQMGVEELKVYLAELEQEAERVREMIETKTKYKGAVEGLFKI